MPKYKKVRDPNWHWKPKGHKKHTKILYAEYSKVVCWHCGSTGMKIGWNVGLMLWVAKCPTCGVTGNAAQCKEECVDANKEIEKQTDLD